MIRRLLLAVLALVAQATPAAAQITIPYSFTFETTIDQDQVNSNFSTLANSALNRTGGTVTGAIASASGSITGSWAGSPTFTANPTFSGTPVFSNAVTMSGTTTYSGTLTSSGGTLSGTWAGSPTLSGTVTVSGNISQTAASHYVLNRTFDASGVFQLKGTNASVEVMNNAGNQNWYFGVKDTDTNALYIGRGYGTGQGATPAIIITAADVVSINGTQAAVRSALLDGANHTDTLAGSVARGDVLVGNSTPKWSRLAVGTASKTIRSDGTDAAWSWPSVSAQSGTFTATDTADVYIVSAAATVNLPTCTGRSGKRYEVKSTTTGTITIDPSGAETIDGAATFAFTQQYSSVSIVCDGTSWSIL